MKKVKNEALILFPEQFKPSFSDWNIVGILNPGGIRLKSGKIVLYVRVAEETIRKGKSRICPVVVSEKEYKAAAGKMESKKVKSLEGRNVYFKSGVCKLNAYIDRNKD